MAYSSSASKSTLAAVLCLAFAVSALAHEHHEVDTGPYEHNFTNEEPIDSILKWHIAIQTLSWGILFPVGMILGLNKSRFHAPFQLVVIALSLFAGNYLGHHHRGRSFHLTAHALFASYLSTYVVVQGLLGAFLKLHVLEQSRVRSFLKQVHRWVGITFPIVGWIQMVFGAIASLGFCFGEHFGQCLAHEIMGGSFVLYAVFMLVMLRFGAGFLKRRNWSQEFLDSTIIMVWGVVNTFTEHDFFRPSSGWSHKDMQHVSLGVLWVCGGLLGMWLSRAGKRSVVPALIIAMTGLAMANHGQHVEFSTTVHKAFGYSLVAAGLSRVVEICFVLSDEPTPSLERGGRRGGGGGVPKAFQHVAPYLLVLSGLTFMAATEEQVEWIDGRVGMDSTTYVNGLFSGAFVVYLVAVALVDVYDWTRSTMTRGGEVHDDDVDEEEGGQGLASAGMTREGEGREGGGGGRGSWWRDVVGAIASRDVGVDRTAAETERRGYESVPLTSGVREGGGGGRRREGGGTSSEESFELEGRAPGTTATTRRAREETSETVFELGDDPEVDDQDRGDDGYWKEDQRRDRV